MSYSDHGLHGKECYPNLRLVNYVSKGNVSRRTSLMGNNVSDMQERVNLPLRKSPLKCLDRYCCEALSGGEIAVFAQKVRISYSVSKWHLEVIATLNYVDLAGHIIRARRARRARAGNEPGEH